MEFLNPAALYGLFALPLLLIPYLLRRKPRRYLFSSLLMFTELGAQANARLLGRLRLPPIFFLQLLLLALMILALGEPVLTTEPGKIAVVLDNSASMQAMEGNRSRFALAQQRAAAIFRDSGSGTLVDLYLTSPRLARFGGTGFAAFEAASAVQGMKPLDTGAPPIDYPAALGRLARDQKYDRVYLITDRPAVGQDGVLRVVTVGTPQPNLAVTALEMQHLSLSDSRLNASAAVTNYSAKDAKVTLTLRGGGNVVASRGLTIPAGGQATASFDGLAPQGYFEAEIDARDALALDNRRFAVTSATRSLRVLGVSPRPQSLASLRAIPGIELEIVLPDAYGSTDRSGYNLEIFHFASSAVLPDNPALYILPPDRNELVDLGDPVANPVIAGWQEGHTLTRYINFSLFRPGYARILAPQVPGDSILKSQNGPLVFAAAKGNINYLVLGFDPFPYLGQQNLPMSIFTLNLLDWYFSITGSRGFATGAPIPLGTVQPGDRIDTPGGGRIALQPGSKNFAGALYQGIYRRVRAGTTERLAVNLQDLSESDLRRSAPIALGGTGSGAAEKSGLLPFWPYFLFASLLLLLLEWFIAPRLALPGRKAKVVGRHAV